MDGLSYFKQLNSEMRRGNTKIITEVKVDTEKIAEAINQKMKRGLAARTTEAYGV